MNNLFKTAFTLIELLVVIAIIGILSGLIVVAMGGITNSANIAKVQVFSNSLRNALMLNLVSEWKFDEGTGQTAADSWSGGNSGTLGSTAGSDANDPVWKTSGCISGDCLTFDGINDYVQFNDATNLDISNYITVASWIYINALPGVAPNDWAQIVGKQAYTGNYCLLLGRVGNMNFYLAGLTGSPFSFSKIFSANSWYYIVGTYDGATVKTYVNGLLTNSISVSGAITTNTYTLLVGTSSAYAFNGSIDEVRIFNAAMPTSQIKEQYYSGLNKLFSNGGITSEEYSQRIVDNSIALKNTER